MKRLGKMAVSRDQASTTPSLPFPSSRRLPELLDVKNVLLALAASVSFQIFQYFYLLAFSLAVCEADWQLLHKWRACSICDTAVPWIPSSCGCDQCRGLCCLVPRQAVQGSLLEIPGFLRTGPRFSPLLLITSGHLQTVLRFSWHLGSRKIRPY